MYNDNYNTNAQSSSDALGWLQSLTPKKIKLLVVGVIAFIALCWTAPNLFETNEFGNYQIKQAAVTGEISVRNKPGLYGQNFGTIHTYKISDENYFSDSAIEGGNDEMEQPIKVLFSDGSTVTIKGMIKFRLSQNEEMQKKLHKDFKSYENVKRGLIRQVVVESLMQTATLMTAEELYSSRRAEFTAVTEDQIRNGIYTTVTTEVQDIDTDGTKFRRKVTSLKTDKDGNFIIRKESPFKKYGIEILQFVIKKPKFDNTITALIAKKKEAEQKKVVAKADAEKAKQDAITVREQGKAKVAKAEAEALIEKKKAVIEAQKNREVAEENAKKALAEAKAIRAKGEAEAHAAKLKVKAGLTPLEKATIEKETRIGIAEANAKFQPAPNAKVVYVNSGGAKGTNQGSGNVLMDTLSISMMKNLIDTNNNK
jgi:regulator of protease activity HflC (stomatin/prohibitin superfamily)